MTTVGMLKGCVLALLLLAVPCAQAANSQAPARASEIWFDIPSQPLASALDSFCAATGIVAAYNGDLAVGQVSGAVKGRYTPSEALALLLKGSGLAADFTTPDAFVVVPLPEGAEAVVKTPSRIGVAALARQDAEERHYSALVQQGIQSALCAQGETKPGDYRAVISFRINSGGRLSQALLLGSTGYIQRDTAIADAINGVSIGEPPPPSMAQPFTMVILPQSSGGTVNCQTAEGVQRHG